MSTNANLPAGFSITSINGVRCTAVPRSLTTLDPNVTVIPFPGAAAAASTTSNSAAAAAQTTSISTEDTSSASSTESTQAPQTSSSAANAANAKAHQNESSSRVEAESSSVAAVAAGAAAVTNAPPAAAAQATTIPDQSGQGSTTEETLSSTTTSTARPASKGTTPTVNSQTALPQAQSDEHATPTASGNSQSGFQSSTKSGAATGLAPSKSPTTQNSSQPLGLSARPRMSTAPVIGGVVGFVALIALVSVLLWLLRRRQRKDRNGGMSPTEYGERHKFYEIDSGSVGPTRRTTKWKGAMGYRVERVREAAADIKSGALGLGASLRSKMTRDEASAPSVNLNRGNSQFMDGAISQHSRNNSSISHSAEHITAKDRLAGFLQGMSEKMGLKNARSKDVGGMDPYARGMSEKQTMNNPPDFSQLLAMDERHEAERRRSRNMSMSSIPNLGSLGLDFSSHDPFADPLPKSNNANQYGSPISPPQASIPTQSTYINEIRRSRGQSMDMGSANNNLNNGPSSRYPSSIATRDSYRDTVFSTNVRKGKGRSDPFDLERPELLRQIQQGAPPPPKLTMPAGPPPPSATFPPTPQGSRAIGTSRMAGTRVQSVVRTPRIISGAPTYGSKYSSGASNFSGWGDPGPDLGSGSAGGSLRGEVVSMGSEDFDWGLAEGNEKGVGGGEGTDISPMSAYSKNSFAEGAAVGKAM